MSSRNSNSRLWNRTVGRTLAVALVTLQATPGCLGAAMRIVEWEYNRLPCLSVKQPPGAVLDLACYSSAFRGHERVTVSNFDSLWYKVHFADSSCPSSMNLSCDIHADPELDERSMAQLAAEKPLTVARSWQIVAECRCFDDKTYRVLPPTQEPDVVKSIVEATSNCIKSD